jgi:hypothetical protein
MGGASANGKRMACVAIWWNSFSVWIRLAQLGKPDTGKPVISTSPCGSIVTST